MTGKPKLGLGVTPPVGLRIAFQPRLMVIPMAGLLAGGLGAGILAIPPGGFLAGIGKKKLATVSTPLPATAGLGHGKGPPVYENPPWIYCRIVKKKKKEEKGRKILTSALLK
jgi:hypothetical protein